MNLEQAARAEAERRWPKPIRSWSTIHLADDRANMGDAFVSGAEWQASLPHPDTARAEAAEAELAEAHTHFAIQGGRIREAQERAQAAEATLVELQPADVLVEGSWIPVAEWPTILGNFMRSSAEYAREAKALHARIAEALALVRPGASVPLGVSEARHFDRLLAETHRILKGES